MKRENKNFELKATYPMQEGKLKKVKQATLIVEIKPILHHKLVANEHISCELIMLVQ